MEREMLTEKMEQAEKVLIGLGEEWQVRRNAEPGNGIGDQEKRIRQAYEALAGEIRNKDYFIVTMATDAVIFDTPLGSRDEKAALSDKKSYSAVCDADERTMEKLNRLFPVKESKADSRFDRIVAPCGNVTWRQCSVGCTKDIWEPGEIPEDICPHCGAPLTGNTVEAHPYIEEGYLPQWAHYNQWLSGTLGKRLLILELGVGFLRPGVIRFPFEKTAYFNQQAFLLRVHEKFPQVTQELGGRAKGVAANSVLWILNNFGG